MEEKLINRRFTPDKRFVHLGATDIDLAKLVRDPRPEEVEDSLREAIKEDWSEIRYLEWGTKLYPFAEASECRVQDRYLIDTYPPLYTNPRDICNDCLLGPCSLKKEKGKCGLGWEAYQAKLSLRIACKGAQSAMVDSRELLEYALREFGRDKEVTYGEVRHDISDHARMIGEFTGIYATKLWHLERALSYAESQLNKLLLASYTASGVVSDFENMTFHAGTTLLVAQEVAEMIKVACLGIRCAGSHGKLEMKFWPPANILGGLGNVDRDKPVIAFVGDNFLPAWTTINYLKENELTEQIEICGIGSVGDDAARYYDRTRIITTMGNASRAIRVGFADLIVASTGCIPLDILGLAKKVESKVIWVSSQGIGGLEDRTDDPIDEIVNDLVGETDVVWCRDVDKVGEIAVRVVKEVKQKRKGDYFISEDEAKDVTGRCREDCDLCFNACSYALPVGKAIRKVKEDGFAALEDVEKGCVLCGKCEETCPENIPILDLMIPISAKWMSEDKFKTRFGRGTVPNDEVIRSAFTLMNSPGFCWVLSCGGSRKITEEVSWIAHELLSCNCVVSIAGCGGAEVARYFYEEGKYLFEKYDGEFVPKNVVFTGSCSCMTILAETSGHWSRVGVHISLYANFNEVAEVSYRLLSAPVILWGVTPERMYTVASAFARYGQQIIVGPVSGFEWKRYLLGNQYDRSKWMVWDTADGKRVETEPVQEHLIIPVETKEEAIVMLWNLLNRPTDISPWRILKLTPYIDQHEEFFGELPDNWQWLVRTPPDLPLKKRAKLLRKLREEYGWDTTRTSIIKAKHRDGRMLDQLEFNREYGIAEARYFTKAPEFVCEKAKEKLREEGYKV
jgi:acetyl-CoA decarbonylase/synthase complex subunit alpha